MKKKKKKKKKKRKGSITLDEVIVILECEPRTLSPEELRKYGELCTRKVAQEKLGQERKSEEILENLRDILQQVVPEVKIDEYTLIMDQLATLSEEINAPDVSPDKRIEEREKSKIQDKLVGRINQEVAINKVKLAEVITKIKSIIG